MPKMPPIHGAMPPGVANFEGKKYLKKIKPDSSTEASTLNSNNTRENAQNSNLRYHTHHNKNQSEAFYNK